MSNINKRCPLQPECERKCAYHGHEQDCDYYISNARPGCEIPEIAKAYEDRTKEMMDLLLEDEDPVRGLVMIPLEDLHPHPDNPRKSLDGIEELAESIKSKGILQNLTVVKGHWLSLEEYLDMAKREGVTKEAAKAAYNPKDHWAPTGYTVLIGHRRCAAAKIAGLTEAPCVVTEMTFEEQISTMMVENLQRKDLSVVEEAYGFQMMLDLGQTVDEVAQSTGFSKATVRKKSSLTRLEEKGLKLAAQRGATMQELLQLNKIHDEHTRNKVLGYAGTSEFQQKLKSALDDQKVAEFCAAILKQLKEADWIKELTDEKTGYNADDYQYFRCFDRHNQKPLVVPTDTDKARYIYKVHNPSYITMYRYCAEAKTLSPADVRKEEFKKAYADATADVKRVCDVHRRMRYEFIHDFSALNSYEPEIIALATRLANTSYGKPNQTYLGRLLGICVSKPDTYEAAVDAADYEREVRNRPTFALLCALYAKLDGPTTAYYEGHYNTDLYVSTVKYKKNPALEILYDALLNLGYGMSEDEKLMRSGKHSTLKVLATLDGRWKKGLNADGSDPNASAEEGA